ncbi:MAG: hypothetical protein PHU04_04145 [Candidatus Peribacteraceae bacterium]|nr:hypothetical protein [Candidatus Peribacteraceae bacterium]
MSDKPELYYKVRVEAPGKPVRYEYITRTEAGTRGLIAQVLAMGAQNAYVKIGSANFQTYRDWLRTKQR